MEFRSRFEEQVDVLLSARIERFAVALIDIDHFKRISDCYGSATGEAFLLKAAERIARLIRPSDTLAPLGGDKFLLAFAPLESDDDLADAINAISQGLREPFIIDGHEIFTSASIGVCCYPAHGRDAPTLRRNADLAMSRVKRDGRDGAALYDPGFTEADSTRALAEQRLRQAIHDRRFCCAFQPKVDIVTEDVVGVETLVRMIGEDGEVTGPGAFVELAIELGLIDDLTLLVVHRIVELIDLINEAFGPKTTISFNVAAKQSSDVAFMQAVVDILRETSFANRLIVEVTEEAFLAKNLFQTRVLPMLREIGVRVSIDDFGTGYSSLSTLADITADELKIDRSFITNIHQRPRNQIVLKAIESLGTALNMSVIAEGVETFEELLYLKTATHIRYVQGYYYSKPLMLEDFTPLRRRDEARKPGDVRGASGRQRDGRQLR